ncbi:nitroreductase family deazaflavin-dependent oxidoreductase [Mycolicibacterium moriokaense]|nr:nitroreductase family deazaflavin-dependent oxidoreductase [Mycolicibacterium moriokaense]
MRSPIWLYRARLGFLLGDRLLLLEHTGRKSGLPRHTVLEVMGHPAPGVYNVASGFGARAQWFRNVAANPDVKVSVGTHVSVPADARTLTQDEADATLASYVAQHRRAWETMKPALESTLGEEITAKHTPLPILELALRQS